VGYGANILILLEESIKSIGCRKKYLMNSNINLEDDMGEKNETRFNDEINLYDFYLILKKRFRFILIIFLVSITATAVVDYFKKPVYRSSFIVRAYSVRDNTPILTFAEVDKLISELDDLRKEKKFVQLSGKLGANLETVKNIDKLSVETVRDSKDLIEVIIDSSDRELATNLKSVLLQYLNQNQFVAERVTILKKNNLYLKEEIEKKMREMESFRNIIFTKIKNERINYLGFNPLQIDEQIINLKQKVVELENVINLLRGFEITTEPNIPVKPVKPKIMLNIVIAGIISFFGGIFLALFIEWFEKQKV